MPVDAVSASKEQPGDIRGNLKNVYPFVLRHWRKGSVGAALILVSTLLSFPQPLIFRYMVDTVIMDRRLNLLAGVVLLMVAISGAAKLSGLLEQFYVTRFEQRVTMDIQEHLLGHLLRLPKAFFDGKETGYLTSRISSDVGGLQWFFSSNIVHLVTNVLKLAGGVCFLLYLEWRLALAALVILPGILLMVVYFSNRLHAMSHWSMEQHARVYSRFQESLSSIPLIKAFSTEEQTTARVTSEMRKIFHLSLEQSTVNSVANLAISSMPSIVNLGVLVVGAYWVIKGQWTLGSLLAFQGYLWYVFGPAQFLAGANLQLQNARASLDRVSALLDIVPEENVESGFKVERLGGEIEFRDVSFSYDGREPVLESISFKVLPGEPVAIVGPSGVGKTTLVSLLLRFYNPTSGEVCFDGRPASEYDLSSLRRRIGYVSQSTALLIGTIAENLRYGNTDATDAEIVRAAQAACIHEFIMSLPDGYASEVGERGVNLSEGQKQRLALARALVKDPDILILDEPTAAMDSITEQSIFEALPSVIHGKTLIVVAHRLSTIMHSDLILVLNEGSIVASGNHEELLASSDFYRSMVTCQELADESRPEQWRPSAVTGLLSVVN